MLALAFFAGAADVIPRTLSRHGGNGFVSALDLWYAVSPGKLVIAQIQVERLSPALWNPILTGLLSMPTWLLLGLPGGCFAWFLRPHRKMTPQQAEDLKRHEEHYQLYDRLVDEAREAGFDDSEDELAPTHKDPETAGVEDGDDVTDNDDFDRETVLPELPNVADGEDEGR